MTMLFRFVGLPPGIKLTVPVVGSHWVASRTDNMPNWYVVDDATDPYTAYTIRDTAGEDLNFLETFSSPKAWKRAAADTYDPPTAQQRHDEYSETIADVQPGNLFVARIMAKSARSQNRLHRW